MSRPARVSYERARRVSRSQIAVELGWTHKQAKERLKNNEWITRGYYDRRTKTYEAFVIDVLRALYGQDEPPPLPGQDFLTNYLKEQQ